MPKNPDTTSITIFISIVSSLLVVVTGMAIFILTNLNRSIKTLFEENKMMLKSFSELKGKCDERHK